MFDILQYVSEHFWEILVAVGTFGFFLFEIIKYFRKKESPETKVAEINKQQVNQIQNIQLTQKFQPTVIVNLAPSDDRIAKILHKKEEFGYTKADQSVEYSYIASPESKYEMMARKLRGFIPNTDLDDILTASAIAKADKEENAESSRKLFKGLKEKSKERGIKIFNRLVSDNSFETRLIPQLDALLQKYPQSNQQVAILFKEIYESFLKSISDFIWVSKRETINEIEKRIRNKSEKVLAKELEEILVFARGESSINNVRTVCNKLRENNDKLDFREFDESKIGGEPAKMFKIFLKGKYA